MTFLPSATLAAVSTYHRALRRARHARRLTVAITLVAPIGGAPFVLVALGMSDAADGLSLSLPRAEVVSK